MSIFKVLYTFSGRADGADPFAGLIPATELDKKGNVYGTAYYGGKYACGTVFTVDPTTRKENPLYTFGSIPMDGCNPFGLLAQDPKTFFGTTLNGGTGGFGTLWKLTKRVPRLYDRVYSFRGGSDGAKPLAGLLEVLLGGTDFYFGTTEEGGDLSCGAPSGCGVVFQDTVFSQHHIHKVLHRFTGSGGDGAYPYAGVIMDSSNNLYGTTLAGGNAYGTVFELTESSGWRVEKVLYSFTGGTDGGDPTGGLLLDAAGNLYGTTNFGGSFGLGTVFELTSSGETVLHSFAGGPSDGAAPYAGVIMDNRGNLYGTTLEGGSSSNCSNGCGTVFELTPNGRGAWTETVLYSFTGGADGVEPYGGLLLDAAGNLYGTAVGGGSGFGTVWRLTP